jgi:predicted nucleotidyltransferase
MKEFNISALQEALRMHGKIDFALLFGSSKDGRLVKDGADVDIALYLSAKPSADMLVEIVGLCQDAIQYDNIDLVVLNDADFQAESGNLRQENAFFLEESI